jgi:response regulator RpfG family c-di-GMP phosphodiesterase
LAPPGDRARRAPALLVVDDEAHILSALRRTLRREGYEILTAESAEEALRLLAARSVDLILSDHKLPGATGLQLLEQAARSRPSARRLLITGATEESPERELRRLGVCALVTKPWEDARLKATLRRALGR